MRFNAYDNKAGKIEAFATLSDAQRHAARSNNNSALSCLVQARGYFMREEYGFAHEWATQSLAHSLGIFGEEHKAAMAMRASWGQPK